jgi:hypothetical protein
MKSKLAIEAERELVEATRKKGSESGDPPTDPEVGNPAA